MNQKVLKSSPVRYNKQVSYRTKILEIEMLKKQKITNWLSTRTNQLFVSKVVLFSDRNSIRVSSVGWCFLPFVLILLMQIINQKFIAKQTNPEHAQPKQKKPPLTPYSQQKEISDVFWASPFLGINGELQNKNQKRKKE